MQNLDRSENKNTRGQHDDPKDAAQKKKNEPSQKSKILSDDILHSPVYLEPLLLYI